ncbi:hypothetical protein AHAS_Ahas03G0167900 [Arachis hypogaea]
MPYANPLIQHIVPQRIIESKAFAIVVCPLLFFTIMEGHRVNCVVRQFGGLQHIPTKPLNIDEMHGHDGGFDRGEWYPNLVAQIR